MSNNSEKIENQNLSIKLPKDLQYLLANEVRFAIISTLEAFREPLTLSKLSIITGYPITTLIHHIPTLVEEKYLKNKKISGKRGKFYELGERARKVVELSNNNADISSDIKLIENLKGLEINDYKKEILKFYSELVKSGDINLESVFGINSLAEFNRNIANFSTELMKKVILDIQNEKINIDIPMSFVSNYNNTLKISNTEQLNEFQMIYLKFVQDLINLQKKIDLENKGSDEKKLEKIHIYFFTTPIVNFSD